MKRKVTARSFALHHTGPYGSELPSDVLPVCADCHEALHREAGDEWLYGCYPTRRPGLQQRLLGLS